MTDRYEERERNRDKMTGRQTDSQNEDKLISGQRHGICKDGQRER